MIVDLQGSDRWQIIDELVDSLVATGKISRSNRDSIAAAVKKRETSMSTGIGFGIGIPHASTDLISDVVYVMGRSRNGITFDALDGKPVHRVILLLVPSGQFQKHVHVLADMAKLVHKIEL